MLLLADIGNSETVIGVRGADGAIARRWRLRTDSRSTPDEIGVLLRHWIDALPSPVALDAFCAASVVPNFTHVLAEAAESHLGIGLREFRWSPALGIALRVDEPERVGADRIANALGAHLAHPGAAIVVDFGTATTFDVVSAEGEFLGGAIAAGIEAAAASLFGRTALLPRIAVGFPSTMIGRTTVENLQIGLYHGATLLVDGLVERIRAEWEPGARVIATGGLAASVAPRCASVDIVDPDLTLKGIGWGHDRIHPLEA